MPSADFVSSHGKLRAASKNSPLLRLIYIMSGALLQRALRFFQRVNMYKL